jgi:hypothetical protein
MAGKLDYVPLDGSYQEAVLDALDVLLTDNTNDNINTAEIKALLSNLLTEQKLTNELLKKIYNPY